MPAHFQGGGRHAARGQPGFRKWLAALLLAGAASLVWLYGAGKGSDQWRRPWTQEGSRPAKPEPQKQGAETAVPAGPVTGPQTLIMLKTFYPACGEEEVRSLEAGAALAGLRREEVLTRYPGYQVEVFRPGQVILRRTQAGPCPDEVVYRTIGVLDGHVVVFAGRPGRTGAVLQDTGIPVERLLPADREKLEQGIPVRGEAEVWRVLEGLGEME